MTLKDAWNGAKGRCNDAKASVKAKWRSLLAWPPIKTILDWWGWKLFSCGSVQKQQEYIAHRTIVYTMFFAGILSGMMGIVGIEGIQILLFWLLLIFWGGVTRLWIWLISEKQGTGLATESDGQPAHVACGSRLSRITFGKLGNALHTPGDPNTNQPTTGQPARWGKVLSWAGFIGVLVLAFVFFFQVGVLRIVGVGGHRILLFWLLFILFEGAIGLWIWFSPEKQRPGLATENTQGDPDTDEPTTGEPTLTGNVLSWAGFIGVFVLAFVFFFQVFRRFWFIHNSAWYGPVLYDLSLGVVALFLIFPMVKIRKLQLKKSGIPWLTIGFGMGFISILVAWGTISMIWKAVAIQDIFEKQRPASQNEVEVSPSGIHIAVALSGGGYRAALIHAGLLAYLKDHNVSVDLLSSVSGGSILGAAIGTGIGPTGFAKALYDRKPGLPYDLMQVWSVFGELFLLPVRSLIADGFPLSFTESYSAHFNRFYGQKTVEQLEKTPLLLVNVTDIQAEPREAREVLYKDLTPEGNRDLVTNLVAASGAFPGPFQPKLLRWPPDKNNKTERRFVDGGVVENLGVEGLLRYLNESKDPKNNQGHWPKVLIISDASGHGNPKFFRSQADFVTLLTGTLDISFELLHRELYALFTGHPDFLQWLKQELPQVRPMSDLLQWLNSKEVEQFSTVPYRNLIEGEPKGNLFTIPIPATSVVMENVLGAECSYTEEGNTRKEWTAAEIQADVRNYKTLYELDPKKVRRAFWLGKVLGRTYYKAIQRAIAASRGFGPSFNFGSIQQDLKCPSPEI